MMQKVHQNWESPVIGGVYCDHLVIFNTIELSDLADFVKHLASTRTREEMNKIAKLWIQIVFAHDSQAFAHPMSASYVMNQIYDLLGVS